MYAIRSYYDDVELPMGRSFIVRSGVTSMLQIATPHTSDEDMEGSIDHWVSIISKKYPKKQAKWIRVPKPKKAKKEEKNNESNEEFVSPALPKVDLSKYDIKEIKKMLKEAGMDRNNFV